jgi:FecR protein
VSGESPERPEEVDAPLEASLERALHRQPLDADALARTRAAVLAEFQAQYGSRGRRRWLTVRAASIAAALVALTLLAGVLLRPSGEGPSIGSITRLENGGLQSRSGWFTHSDLREGAPLHVGERYAASGSALIALVRGGTVRVAPGSVLEAAALDELVLKSGTVYLDLANDTGAFILRTPVGTIEHLGTGFEVAAADRNTRVRVREGAVRVRTVAGTEVVEAATELLIPQTGTVVRRAIPTYGPDWAWIEAIAPDYDIEDRPLGDFLTWVARETGRRIDFADDRAREVANRTRLHGSVQGLAPLDALDRVLSTTSLRFELHGDTIRVSSRR